MFSMEKKRGLIIIRKPTIKLILLVSMYSSCSFNFASNAQPHDAFMKLFLLETK